MAKRVTLHQTQSRRGFITGVGSMVGAATLAPVVAMAQQPNAATGTPPTVISNPPRQWGPHAPPSIYPDPDVIVIDPSFAQYRIGITAIHRVATGFLWAEGPAWSSEGQYFVFSDVQADTQYRLLWDNRRTTAFRKPSSNSNGNSFDFQGRQLSTQDFFRRVIRWEHDGTMTVIADSFDGKPLNSPNDLVPHPDGSIWFTDPPYGTTLSEGHPDEAGGPTNPQGLLNPRIGAENAGAIGGKKRQLPNAVYRWDPSGRLDQVITEDQLKDPNGLCFSPDYKTLYVCSTGQGPGDSHSGGTRTIHAFDVQGGKVTNGRDFLDMTVDGVKCGPDGLRADVAGNLWCSSNAPLGYAGVLVYNAQGKLIGRIRLPEVCANLCFGGPKRNQLLMTAAQSIYMLQVQTQGAAPG
jgi:gluconolactonase